MIVRRGLSRVFFGLFLFVFLSAGESWARASLRFSPGTPAPGQNVTFNYANPNTTECLIWDFGDGSARKELKSRFTLRHAFSRAGRYQVKVWDMTCDDGGRPTVQVTVTVRAPKKTGVISYKPSKPKEGEEITFGAKGFRASCVRWDFGDGAKEKDTTPYTITHRYHRPGTYKVRMYGDCGKDESGQTTITVYKVDRRLLADKNKATVGDKVSFAARNFLSRCVLWDFGDGKKLKGGKTESHIYKAANNYTVKAYDFCGKESAKPVLLHIRISNKAFSILKARLYFDHSRNVAKVEAGNRLSGLATIEYRGSGIVRYQWRVDNKPIGGVRTLHLTGGNKSTTQKLASISLPTQQVGRHRLSLRFFEPKGRLRPVNITYLVKHPKHYKVKLTFRSYTDKLGKTNVFSGNTLKGKKGDHLKINGAIFNEGSTAIPEGYLRIYIGSKLIGTQSIRSIQPGKLIPFDTSIKFPDAPKSEISFRFVEKNGAPIRVQRLNLMTKTLKNPAPSFDLRAHTQMKILNFSVVKPVIYIYGDYIVDVKVQGAYEAYISVPRRPGKSGKLFHRVQLTPDPYGNIDQTVAVGDAVDPDTGKKIRLTNAKGGLPDQIPLTLVIKGRNSAGQIAYMQKKIIQHIRFHNSHGQKPKIIDFSFNILWLNGRLWQNYGQFSAKTLHADKYKKRITYLKTGKVLSWGGNETIYQLTELSEWDYGNHDSNNNPLNADLLPGSGFYELQVFNECGMDSTQIYITLPNQDVEHFIQLAKLIGCQETSASSKNQFRYSGKAKGSNYFLMPDCKDLLKRPEYKEYKKYWDGTKPKVKLLVSSPSSLLAGKEAIINSGSTAKLLYHIADSSSNNTLRHNTFFHLYKTDLQTNQKKLILKKSYAGELDVKKEEWRDDIVTAEYFVSPKKSTKYTLIAKNRYGTTSATVTVRVRNYSQPPAINNFSVTPNMGVKEGETVTVSYDISNAVTAVVMNHDTGAVYHLKVPPSGFLKGSLSVKVARKTNFELLVKNGKGTTVTKNISVYMQTVPVSISVSLKTKNSQKNQTGTPPVVQIKKGEAAILSYQCKGGKKIEIYDNTSKKEIKVFSVDPGKITEGKVTLYPKQYTEYLVSATDINNGATTKKAIVKVAHANRFKKKPYINQLKAVKTGQWKWPDATVNVFDITYEYLNADEAYLIEKWSGDIIATLPVAASGGTYQSGSIEKGIPSTVKRSQAGFILKLINAYGTTTQEVIPVKATSSKSADKTAPRSGRVSKKVILRKTLPDASKKSGGMIIKPPR